MVTNRQFPPLDKLSKYSANRPFIVDRASLDAAVPGRPL
jgi:hypothetical protein